MNWRFDKQNRHEGMDTLFAKKHKHVMASDIMYKAWEITIQQTTVEA